MSDTPTEPKRPLWRRTVTLIATLGTVGIAGVLVATGSQFIAANAERLPQDAEIAPIAVLTAPVSLQQSYSVPARYQGRVEARQQVGIGFEAGGTIAEVLVDEGDRVSAGTVLARLDTRALDADRAAQEAARDALAAQLELAELTADRQKALLDRSHASAQRYDEARLSAARLSAELRRAEAAIAAVEIALSKAELVAPFDATIAARLLDAGARSAPGQAALQLLETRTPEFRLGLPEDVAAALSPGDPLVVDIAGSPLPAAVARLRPDVDPATRTVPVILSLPDGTGLLPDGTLGTVTLSRSVPGAGAWVPLEALSEGIRGLWTVFVVTDGASGPVARREAVELVHTEATRAFVRGAFAEGARIVAEGTHRLADGQPITQAALGG